MADEVHAVGVEVDVEGNQVEKDIQGVLKAAMAANGLYKGLRECVKCLVRGEGRLCFLAQDTKEESYTKLIRALCDHQEINMVQVDSRERLGEWVGLFKTDKDGNPREDKRKVGCSCVVISDFGIVSDELRRLLASFQA